LGVGSRDLPIANKEWGFANKKPGAGICELHIKSEDL
jgi:hypothetical protein